MVEPANPELSTGKQCRLLSIPRPSFYCTPKGETALNLMLMRQVDEQFLETPFCDPQAPWQKGTVENTNNRLRRYLPRSTEPTALTNRYLRSICHRLNSTPRKCIGCRTPAEVFEYHLIEIQNQLE